MRGKVLEVKLELSPEDWLSWSDEAFNEWRREHDFPRIVNFLFETLPYFSIWLSEQTGLTRQDLVFHGPARFIRLYGEPMKFIEHDVSLRLDSNPPKPILRYCFEKKGKNQFRKKKVTRQVEFCSYIDWAYKNRSWIFYKNPSSIEDFVRCLTPSGRSCNTSTFINSDSSIQFNIPSFMPSVTIDDIFFNTKQRSAPPSLRLLKLGGGGVTDVDGVVGEKNLEFANIDNLTLINPIITSFQDISFSTLRNLKIHGQIHAAKFHQCSIEIDVSKGGILECDFEYCDSTISLNESKLFRSSIREKYLRLKLKDTEVSDCCFEYLDICGGSATERRNFNQSAKMTYSHLGYPDLAGKHFYFEQKEKRKGLWKTFSDIDSWDGIGRRLLSLFGFIWMTFQELYWGYGERPFNIILFSLFAVISFSLFGYFNQSSSTAMDLGDSLIFSFQAFTNITIKDVNQGFDVINLIGSIMSFFGIISVGLLVAALSAKTKDYN